MHFWKSTCAVLSGFIFFVGGLLCFATLQVDPSLGIASIILIFLSCFVLSFAFLIGYAVFDIAENMRAMTASSTSEPKAKKRRTMHLPPIT